MNFQEEVNKIKNSLVDAREVLVVINKTPNLDSVASGLALYLGLSKLGKKVTIFCEDEIKVEFSDLIGVNKITNGLGGKNFIVSLDYKEGSIDKVSYNIEGDKFNLVIEPRPDAPQLTSENVHYSYSGAAADLIFVVDASSLKDLGKIYEKKKEIFVREKIVNISCRQGNENFGKVNLVVSQAASNSEIVILLLKSLGMQLDQDIATNLLAGISFSTNNFNSPKTNATTFETAALCLRAGARKISFSPTKVQMPKFQTAKPQKKPIVFPAKKREPSFVPPAETLSNEKGKILKDKEEKKGGQAPPDWLKPKIYKGSTLL